jgi:hypothetical protein
VGWWHGSDESVRSVRDGSGLMTGFDKSLAKKRQQRSIGKLAAGVEKRVSPLRCSQKREQLRSK